MERAKNIINDLKLLISESVMEGYNLDIAARQKIYNSLKEIEAMIDKAAKEKEERILEIPKLPKGENHNPYPRFLYVMICEFYSRDKYFTISDMVDLTGASRNQVKNDLDRLKREGYITLVHSFTAERGTRYYKFKPTKLL